MRKAAAALLLLGALAANGCGSDYEYVPVSNATSLVEGRPAANVRVPPELPHGDVRLATFGIAEVKPQGAAEEAPKIRVLHLRIIVANNNQQPWQLDTREQRVELAGRGTSRAAYASVDVGAPPIVLVPPGGKRTVDLFFPLPADMQQESALPAFDAIWTVQTDERVVTERTPFERMTIEPRYPYGYEWNYYWGHGWWYDPGYPGNAWGGGVVLPPAYTQHPVIVNGPVYAAPPSHGR
jgi:hypothetical protein